MMISSLAHRPIHQKQVANRHISPLYQSKAPSFGHLSQRWDSAETKEITPGFDVALVKLRDQRTGPDGHEKGIGLTFSSASLLYEPSSALKGE